MEIEVVLAADATIGESPTWEPAEQALYWIDVKRPTLYRFDPATGSQRSWTMCAFAGEALDVLYVTSAAEKLTPEQRQREPLAGALLRLRPGETGVARP